MSLPIKSVLRALKRDLEQVALMAIGEIRFVYCQAAGPTRGVIMRSCLQTHVLFNATCVESNAQIVSLGNWEEQLPLTDCRSTVGRQVTDTLPIGHRQSSDRLPTVSQNRNFTVKLSSKHRSKPDTESD